MDVDERRRRRRRRRGTTTPADGGHGVNALQRFAKMADFRFRI